MKINYINILLFALPLNILLSSSQVHNQRNYKNTTLHTRTNRSLCECELYAPFNYDNDPQMKEVMDNFNKQTQQRFHEYDERMKEKRMQCKEQCNKEIQKIILKDKLEKELMDKFSTLQTDIQSDAIPTCICEKSIADKVEKGFLLCGGILGAAMPELGAMGATALYTLNQLKPYALFTAAKYAIFKGAAEGAVAGKAAGMDVVIHFLKKWGIQQYCSDIYPSMLKIKHFTDLKDFANSIFKKYQAMCVIKATGENTECVPFGVKLGVTAPGGGPKGLPPDEAIPQLMKGLVYKAELTATDEAAKVSSSTYSNIINEQTALIDAGVESSTASIYASIIAIVVIVLIMVIIYLILRYRRKKKMKKKLQYIKLLEE